MMKKIGTLIMCMTVWGAALFAQVGAVLRYAVSRFAMAAMGLIFAGLLINGCAGGPKTNAGTAAAPTYYVRANGNDQNSGLSEDAPFKTLHRAVDAANKRNIKTITVLGTLNEESEGRNSLNPNGDSRKYT